MRYLTLVLAISSLTTVAPVESLAQTVATVTVNVGHRRTASPSWGGSRSALREGSFGLHEALPG